MMLSQTVSQLNFKSGNTKEVLVENFKRLSKSFHLHVVLHKVWKYKLFLDFSSQFLVHLKIEKSLPTLFFLFHPILSETVLFVTFSNIGTVFEILLLY